MNAAPRLVKTVELVITDTMTTCVIVKVVTLERTVRPVSMPMAFCVREGGRSWHQENPSKRVHVQKVWSVWSPS